MFYEFRTYTAAPGKILALSDRFRDTTVELFAVHGINLVGFWKPKVGPIYDTLHYLIKWESAEQMEIAWKALLEDPKWRAAVAESEKDGPLLARVESELWNLTEYSPEV